jgi:hypothetical protein
MLLELSAVWPYAPVGCVARARNLSQSHQHHQNRSPGQLVLITTIGPLPDAMHPGFHCVRTHWIRGFMTFQLAPAHPTVMLMVPMCPESVSGTCRPAAVH